MKTIIIGGNMGIEFSDRISLQKETSRLILERGCSEDFCKTCFFKKEECEKFEDKKKFVKNHYPVIFCK